MKRLLILVCLALAVPAAGFLAGSHGVEAWRQLTRPDAWRQGDFGFVVDAVGSSVVLLSTSTCPWCEKTRQWLARAGVDHRECVVDRDDFARGLLARLGVDTVPQLVTAHAAVAGYDEALFERIVREAAGSSSGGPPLGGRCELPQPAAKTHAAAGEGS